MKAILALAILCCPIFLFGQVGINIGSSKPHPSAAFQINPNPNTNAKGFLVPQLSTNEINAITSPAKGLMVYNSTTNSFWFYNGTSWQNIGGGDNLGNHTATSSINMPNGQGINYPKSSIKTDSNGDGIIIRSSGIAGGDAFSVLNGNASLYRVNNTGEAYVLSGIKIGNTSTAVAGMVRWTGTDFEGYNGTSWVSLTQANKPDGIWVPALNHQGTSWYHSPCAATCSTVQGYGPASNPQGYSCIGASGPSNYVSLGSGVYKCGGFGSSTSKDKNYTLFQCYCIKVN